MNPPTREKACTGKKAHGTLITATAYLGGLTYQDRRGGMNAYKCPFCPWFHIGHNPLWLKEKMDKSLTKGTFMAKYPAPAAIDKTLDLDAQFKARMDKKLESKTHHDVNLSFEGVDGDKLSEVIAWAVKAGAQIGVAPTLVN